MNLILLHEQDRLTGNRYKLSDHRADHIINILKSAPDDILEIGLVNQFCGRAAIAEVSGNTVTLEIFEKHPPQEKRQRISVICALPRPQTLKKVLLVAGMMGLDSIDFIRANRVEKSYYQSNIITDNKIDNYLIEGMSQGKHYKLPTVSIYNRFRPYWEDIFPQKINDKSGAYLLPDLDAEYFMERKAIEEKTDIVIAIGPEGGWVDYEMNMISSLGFYRFKLSASNLRVEYALTSVLAQIELLK